jgi:hypothetical protein
MTLADTALLVTAAGSLVAAVAAIGSVFMSARNAVKIREVHLSVNSRLDLLIASVKTTAHAAGVQEERDRKA